MRAIGLDLGIKTLGIAISDKTNSLASPLALFEFPKEEYNIAVEKVLELVKDYQITDIALGLPKNMDNSLGFAADRSLKFKDLLEEKDLNVHLIDERLTTVSAFSILKNNGNKKINQSKKLDSISACLILESFLKEYNYEK